MNGIGIVVLFGWIVFARSIRGEFLFDDPAIWDMTDPNIPDPTYEQRKAGGGQSGVFRLPGAGAGFWRMFWTGFHKHPRALTNLTYIWTWKIWRFRPIGWHWFNLNVHAINVYLVWFLADTVLHDSRALLAAAIFAVHPLQASAVCYISGRAAMLATLFTLCGLALFATDHYLLTLLAEYFAWKSKQDAPVYALLYPVYWYLLK